MRVFLTGATGFIGTAIIAELHATGHDVLGLARSDAAAESLTALGVGVHRGDVEDLASLRSGAEVTDGVIHAGFIHDFSRFQEVCEIDRRAIETLGATLAGSDRPLVVTSGTANALTPGRPATEDDAPNSPVPRVATERGCETAAANGANVAVVRLPQVHDPIKQGLVTYLIALAREKGVSAYVGDGANRWAAGHVGDVARLYRLALEHGAAHPESSGVRYNAVGEEGIPMREIAWVVGRVLEIPVVSVTSEEAGAHFGWLEHLIALDMPASSALTQARLGWNPTGPGLIADLAEGKF